MRNQFNNKRLFQTWTCSVHFWPSLFGRAPHTNERRWTWKLIFLDVYSINVALDYKHQRFLNIFIHTNNIVLSKIVFSVIKQCSGITTPGIYSSRRKAPWGLSNVDCIEVDVSEVNINVHRHLWARGCLANFLLQRNRENALLYWKQTANGLLCWISDNEFESLI